MSKKTAPPAQLANSLRMPAGVARVTLVITLPHGTSTKVLSLFVISLFRVFAIRNGVPIGQVGDVATIIQIGRSK
jgi:hypothetical protein